MRIVNAFIEPMVREAIEKRRNPLAPGDGDVKLEDEKGETLLDHLVSLTSDLVVLKDEKYVTLSELFHVRWIFRAD